MKKITKPLWIACIAIALIVSSCSKDETALEPTEEFSIASLKASTALPPMPTLKRSLPTNKVLDNTRFDPSNLVVPSECEPTDFDRVISESVSSNIDSIGQEWYSLYAEMNFYYTLTDSDDQYFGKNGMDTRFVKKTIRGLERFWNMKNEVTVRGQHNETLNNRGKIISTLNFWYGVPLNEAEVFADYFINVVNVESTFLTETPLLSLDGFAIALEGQLGQNDLIVLGDGLVELAAETGIRSNVVIAGILGHEWAHQIQFNNFDEWYPNGAADNTPEATRTTELEADFFTGYYLSHKRGYNNNWRKTEQFLQLFFNIGDCGFMADGHHGTPKQRMNAAKRGYKMAQRTQARGKILNEQKVHKKFLKRLPKIVAVDEVEMNSDDDL